VRAFVEKYTELNQNEKAALYNALYDLARAAYRCPKGWQYKLGLRTSYDSVLRVARRVKRNTELKAKRKTIKKMIADKNNVFFICSTHPKPRPEHKPYQGVLFVDRFWRQKVKGEQYYAVMSYIKNHNTTTIQGIQQEPVYLCTAPYCRHFFIPVPTSTVLTTSAKALAERKQKKLYTSEQYYELRSEVYNKLDNRYPCYAFNKKRHKQTQTKSA
jgi:hypothetical protein